MISGQLSAIEEQKIALMDTAHNLMKISLPKGRMSYMREYYCLTLSLKTQI